ncbi:MAG: AbrB/MazE/SpoVT family DNA-binding domain-containing protein [Nanoarchaeota archaeon]
MKKFPKIVQCDKRGQIVIPKDIRQDLSIEEGTGFWMYSVTDEGILLKKIDAPPLDEEHAMTRELEEKVDKIGLNAENLEKAKKNYKKTTSGNLELL